MRCSSAIRLSCANCSTPEDPGESIICRSRDEVDLTDQGAVCALYPRGLREFSGHAIEEIGTVAQTDPAIAPALKPGTVVVQVDRRCLRPTEVDSLLGDASKARRQLGWTPEISLEQMIDEMVTSDRGEARKHALLQRHGFTVNVSGE